MLGQHIYSRCAEGYFSSSSGVSDSTTVTISAEMFRNMEQAKKVAKECETIGKLEDNRYAPDRTKLDRKYRGVLKIKNISSVLTVVCRAYRMWPNQISQREFSFSSSYLLTGEEREYFFDNMEYCLNCNNFESAESVEQRIEEARRQGKNGKIEVNKEYSLFNGASDSLSLKIFEKAGFTRELFIDYISSVIQRTFLCSRYGKKGGKVLLYLPDFCRSSWNTNGGNIFAEQLMILTYKILPSFIRNKVNAVSCGGDPNSVTYDNFQLLFMEDTAHSNSKEWLSDEISIIDLNEKRSYVTTNIDRTYAGWLWDHMDAPDDRESYEEIFARIFGRDKNDRIVASQDETGFILRLLDQVEKNFINVEERHNIILEVISRCVGRWTEDSGNYLAKMLQKEALDAKYNSDIEELLVAMLEKKIHPQSCYASICDVLFQYIYQGMASANTVDYMKKQLMTDDKSVENGMLNVVSYIEKCMENKREVPGQILELCKSIMQVNSPKKGSQLYLSVCETLIKLANYYSLEGNQKKYLAVQEILKEQLEDRNSPVEVYKGLYEAFIHIIFTGDAEISGIVSSWMKKEEEKFNVLKERNQMFHELFLEKIATPQVELNAEVIYHFMDTLLRNVEDSIRDAYKIYVQLVESNGSSYIEKYYDLLFHETREQSVWYLKRNAGHITAMMEDLIRILELYKLKQAGQRYLPNPDIYRPLGQILVNKNHFIEILFENYKLRINEDEQERYLLQLKGNEFIKLFLWAMRTGENRPELREYFIDKRVDRFQLLEEAKKWNLVKEEYDYILPTYFRCIQKEYNELIRESQDTSLQVWCEQFQAETEKLSMMSVEKEFLNNLSVLFIKQLDKRIQIQMLCEIKDQQIYFLEYILQSISSRVRLSKEYVWYYIEAKKVVEELSGDDERAFTKIYRKFESIRANVPDLCGEYGELTRAKLKEYLQRLRSTKEKKVPIIIYKLFMLYMIMTAPVVEQIDWVADIAGKISKNSDSYDMLQCAFALMNIVATNDLPHYDNIRYGVRSCVWSIASETPEVFCDEELAKEYKKLKDLNKNQLELGRYLKDIPERWKAEYGIRRGRSTSGNKGLLIGVSSGVLVFCILLNVLFGIFMKSIPMPVGISISVILCVVGIVGLVFSLVPQLKRKIENWLLVLITAIIILVSGGVLLAETFIIKNASSSEVEAVDEPEENEAADIQQSEESETTDISKPEESEGAETQEMEEVTIKEQ